MDTRSHSNSIPELHNEATQLIKALVTEDSPVTRELLGCTLAEAFNTMTGHLQTNYQAIERAKHEWETSLDAVPDPVFIHDREFKVMRCNRAYAEAAGLPFREIIGRPYYEMFPKMDGPMEGCCKVLERQEDGEEEIFVHAVDRVFNAKFHLVRDADGAYIYSLHILQDVTARKKAEKKLKESEARYRRITEGLTDYQYTVRIENGRAVETTQSPACVMVTGYTAEEYAANPYLWIQMVVPEDRERVMQHVQQILAGDDVSPIEHRITRKNGETRWISDTTILFRDASGKLLSYDGVIKDITERKKAEKELHDLFLAAMESLASAIEAKSPWTRGHSERVADYAAGIGQALGLTNGELEKLRIAALLHDIGKIGTYDGLLEKPGKLTDAEYETIKQHPGKGAEMLAPIKQLHDIIPWVRGHHERFDGAGYPDGLKGEDIPFQARILAVADTFDSMTAERPYRATPGKVQAFEEIQRHAGTQFDPRVVEAFLRAGTEPLASPSPQREHWPPAIHSQGAP